MNRLLLALVPLIFVGACYSEEPAVGVSYGYGYANPTMESVGPGVQVIDDYDYPVFYTDGFYWRWYGNSWYRSPYWNRGWGASYGVPYGLRGIAHPEMYAHYHGGFYGGYRGGYGYRGAVGYRGAAGGYHGAYRGPARGPAPAYRGAAHASAGHRR